MFLGFTTLFTALCISGIAAYYSIVGLTAIFAGTFWPIVVMGGVLEAGKVVTTLWLHYNWERASYKIKAYLVTAVVVLMLITSMGIFGFLSKSHLDQATPSGDIQAQVSLFDEKIKTQRDNIEASRKALVQMDGSVDQLLARTTDETGATKAANLRRSQQKERGKLQGDIDAAQKEIAVLQEKRAPLASQFRKVEAEVGPIKYIAALIYGPNTDQNMLEAAVRWVIIIIVFVFDPLAIVLILAATTSIDWSKVDRRKIKDEQVLANNTKQVEQQIQQAIEITKQQCEIEWGKERNGIIHEHAILLEQHTIDGSNKVSELHTAKTELMTEVSDLTNTVTELITPSTSMTAELTNIENQYLELSKHQQKLESDLLTMISYYDELIDNSILSKEQFAIRKQELERQLVEANEVIDQLLTIMPAIIVENNSQPITVADAVNAEHVPTSINYDDFIKHDNEIELVTPLPKQPAIVEEQPISGSLTNPDVARRAFEAVYFYDKPEYFNKQKAEVVAPVDTAEIQLSEEPVEQATEKVLTVVQLHDIPEVVPLAVTDLPDDYGSIVVQPVPQQIIAALPAKRNVERQVDVPDFSAKADNFPMGGNASFGIQFPSAPLRGDLFLRVDFLPSKLFKWVGSRWIEIDKSNTDAFIYDVEYIKLLVDKVATGEYDIDDLNVTEQEQVAEYLRKSAI